MYCFASDIHLGAGEDNEARENERRFVEWLDRMGREAEAIYLVGDIFDFWFEYRRVVPSGFVRVLGKLAGLADRGIRVIFFTGNHDMWTGDCLARECGLEIHTEPQLLTLCGQRIFVAHGDNLQIHDRPLLRLLNRIFRSRALRWFFSRAIHPDFFVRFGRWWSGRSRKSHRLAESSDNTALTEPLIAFARSYAAARPDLCVDHFVFGHMHVARDFRDGALHTIHLGCWESAPTYARLDNTGELTLESFVP